jgi:transcriptional regulator with XRE-family HTH domain
MPPRRTPLARYLRELRGDRYSLRDVERLTNREVSNVYLSQLETGTRSDPHPRILMSLAKVYDIPVETLYEKAGYVDQPARSDVDIAFSQVLADREFQFGTRFKGALDDSSKRVIIDLYERATGKKLLAPGGDDDE